MAEQEQEGPLAAKLWRCARALPAWAEQAQVALDESPRAKLWLALASRALGATCAPRHAQDPVLLPDLVAAGTAELGATVTMALARQLPPRASRAELRRLVRGLEA
jgi:hypothetical protein